MVLYKLHWTSKLSTIWDHDSSILLTLDAVVMYSEQSKRKNLSIIAFAITMTTPCKEIVSHSHNRPSVGESTINSDNDNKSFTAVN
jgi:hypothetical protein